MRWRYILLAFTTAILVAVCIMIIGWSVYDVSEPLRYLGERLA